MDPMMKMLCSLLKIKPEELQASVENIQQGAKWFHAEIEAIRAEQVSQRETLQEILDYVRGVSPSAASVDDYSFPGTVTELDAGNVI